MAHPYASQAKASQKRRLSALGAKAGKSFGSSSMYKKTSYPSKGAGTSRELTISGGTALKRADRAPQKLASGGFVGGGTKKKSRKGHSTTNIVIASPGGGSQPTPVPVPRPVPVPVPVGGAGAPPPVAPRPPMAPPPGAGMGGPPVNVNVPPPAAAPPMPGRPPGLADGGTIKGSTYHNWGKGYRDGGSVKKKANGGSVSRGRAPSREEEEEDRPPINPMALFGSGSVGGGSTGAEEPGAIGPEGFADGAGFNSPVGQSSGGGAMPVIEEIAAPAPAPDIGGGFRMKKGGAVKKRQFGGGTGQPGLGPQLAGPRKPFAPGAVPGQRPGAKPPVVPLTGGRPTRPGYKDGGKAKHEDEAQDKKLIAKMMKSKKYADGGGVEEEQQTSSTSDTKSGGLGGVMKALTGVDKALNPRSSTAGDYGVRAAQGAQDAATKAGQAVAGSTQALARSSQNAGFKPGAVPGATGGKNMFQLKKGGSVKKYKIGGDVTGAFSTKEQDKYGTSTFRGGKYENEPTVVKERTKGFNQPMGQDVSEDVAAEKRTRGTHYNKGGVVKRAGAGSGLGRLAAAKRA